MSDRLFGYLLLTLAMATVGTTVIASKLIAASMPPFTATALRFAMALPMLLLLMGAWRAPWPRLARRDWLLVVLQAASGSVGYTVLLISGLRFVPAADAGILIGALPAVAALFSVVVLGDRPSPRVLVSIALATTGVLAVVSSGTTPTSLLGSLLILGAVVAESAFILLNKRLRTPVPPLAQSTLMTAFGLALALPVALVEAPLALPDAAALGAITYYAVVPTVGGFLLWYAGAARVSGSEAALFTAVAPITAVALAALLLGEPITTTQVLGAAAVVLAAAVLVLRPLRTPLTLTE